MKRFTLLLLLSCLSAASFAQHPHHNSDPHAAREGMKSPYADMVTRPIKALSSQQIEDLRAGKGMAMALAAELNGYPGPLHVLEMKSALKLAPEQKSAIERLYAQMKQETSLLGPQLIEAERQLNNLFSEKKASPESIETATANAARIQGALRAAHLRYHVYVAELLRPDQVTRYNQLRGY